jgi:aryl-alcohol dehydrogenase-like predicted oxidoreductase
MRKIKVPKTDLQASMIVLGTDYFGSTVSRQDSMQLMDYYLEAGGNVLDTAEVYASFVPGGEHQSETVIGEWLRDRQVRDQVILSTKGAHPKLASMDIPRMSKAEIQSDLDSSLQRLRAEYIDLYWLHRDAPGYPVEEILQSLESFRQAGKIRYIGFSNWTQTRAEEARLAAQHLGIQGFVASQNMWSLAKADLSQSDPTWGYMDESFAQWHLKNGLAAFPFISQAGGYFRRLDQGALDQLSADNRVRRMFDHQENHARFQRIRRLQEKTKLSVSQIVLGYLTNQPFPVFPLIGPKTLPDLRESISNAGATLPQAALSYLEHGNRSLVGSIF